MKTKKNVLALLILGGSLLSFSCRKQEALIASNEPAVARSVTDHIIETGMSLSQINAVIAGSSAGQTVLVQPGTYNITGKIVMKAGVSIANQTATSPVFDATGLSNILNLAYSTEVNNCTFSGITFWNIKMTITSAKSVKIKGCIFDYGKRKVNTNKTNNLSDAYLNLNSTDSALVYNCTFNHRSTDPGRGVWVGTGSTNDIIRKNTFGNGGSTGYFVCAVNDNSLSNSLIDSNTVARNTVLNSVDSLTDHGMYAHSFNGLTIKDNTFTAGWPTNASGGNIKARNGQYLTITNNTMNDSGILLYEYVSGTANPFLKYVVVSNNTINVSSAANDIYHGIGYYRDNTTDSEYSINITGNLLPNGTIQINGANVNVANFNAAGGGVFNNDTATGYLLLKSGINNSGNY